MSAPKRVKLISSLVLVVFLAVFMVAPAAYAQDDGAFTDDERILIDLYNNVSPSVVSIQVDRLIQGGFQEWSGGSGFVVDNDGYIVTNYHVIEGGDRISVRFFDGIITRGEIVGIDPDSDLAVIQVDLPRDLLRPLKLANSDAVVVGQSALAIGSPFGQDWTLTTGIISALDREIGSLGNYNIGAVIQTDTAINPGNSGGPLLNLRGEVIGVNAQIISEERANSGIAFAVPSNLVQRVIADLIEFGEVNYSYLGIDGEDLTLDFVEDLSLPFDVRGVVVTDVVPGQPADQAGLLAPVLENQRGRDAFIEADIIVAVNDRPVTNFATLLGYISTYTRPGETVQMTVYRGGSLVDLNLTLGAR